MTTSLHLVDTCSTEGDACDFSIAENLCDVISNEWVNEEYKHLVLNAPATALAVQPGQFFHLLCPPVDGNATYLRRPMSLYRVSSSNKRIEFLYKVQGAGTRGLATLTAGDTLNALGPVGVGFQLPEACRHVLILARGVGLATMASLAEHAIARGAAVTAILSARSPRLVMSADYLRSVGARVLSVHDDDGSSAVEAVRELIAAEHRRAPFDLFTTCGSNRLLQLLKELGAQWQVPGQVAMEQHMGCALGMCFACVKPFRKYEGADTISYRRVCWDGPVFNLQETVSW